MPLVKNLNYYEIVLHYQQVTDDFPYVNLKIIYVLKKNYQKVLSYNLVKLVAQVHHLPSKS